MRHLSSSLLSMTIGLVFLTACASSPRPGDRLERRGDEIVICGQLYHTGTPVVLWTDPGGYDAYRVEPRFADSEAASNADDSDPGGARYHTLRRHLPDPVAATVREHGWSVKQLAEYVDLFVVHYDVCGTSRRCFEVLHDKRHLSVHFMLDSDGTLYQTLDVKERAWHAGTANDRSIGVEIAHIGAYGDDELDTLDRWYDHDAEGPYLTYSDREVTGIRTPRFVGRPARAELIEGEVQGRALHQYDFTDEQYEALARLLATLNRVLPRIELDAPRDDHDEVVSHVLDDASLARYSGVVGHYHTSDRKIDPGPAFDWDRVLNEARALRD